MPQRRVSSWGKITMNQLKYSINSDAMQVLSRHLPAPGGKISKKDAGHVYTASLGAAGMQQKAIYTLPALRASANEQYTTANTFFHPRWGRNKKNLRWLNAIVLDIDKIADAYELALKIDEVGLPQASMYVKTPSGLHAWWYLRPARATAKAIRLYEALQAAMAAAVGADPAAVGTERLWRMPTGKSVIYSTSKKYKLSAIRAWRDENYPPPPAASGGGKTHGEVYMSTRGLLQHPAVLQLLRGVPRGQRDNACFAAAVAHLAAGCSETETEQILQRWNELNAPPLPAAAVLKCVRSAARGLGKNYTHYYNAMRSKIREITGISVKYRPLTAKKPREERKRAHITEREQDIVTLIQARGGKMMITQSKLAKMLNAPARSVKAALSALARSKSIVKIIIARGRRSVTVLIVKISQRWKKQMVHTRTHYRGGAACGGWASPPRHGGSDRSAPEKYCCCHALQCPAQGLCY